MRGGRGILRRAGVINARFDFDFEMAGNTRHFRVTDSSSCRNRSVGCRVRRVIGSQGRAAARVRIRQHVVRVQNRDTEIGAVVRTTRASRDVNVASRCVFGAPIMIAMASMVSASYLRRDDCIFKVFEDISVGGDSIAEVCVLVGRGVP